MMNYLKCRCFNPDPEGLEYYKEQIKLWKQKSEKSRSILMIMVDAEQNAEILKKCRKIYIKLCKRIDFYTQIKYNIGVKVRGDVMDYAKKLKKLISDKKGFIVTSDLNEHNIPRQLLKNFVELGLLEKIDRGAYISPETFDDEMYRLQARFKPIIYSHDTALYFHNLIDRDPIEYTVTVYSGYQTTKLKEMGINTFSIKKDLFELGLSEGKTIFGRPIRIYDAERAVCDCIRSRSKMDVSIITDALKRYVKSENKNIPKLMRYAELFKISSIIRGYLEVLL